MSSFTIRSDIPVPEKLRTPRPSVFPFQAMKAGDSFFVADKTVSEFQGNLVTGYKLVPNSSWAVRSSCESGVQGIRVWRIA